MVKKSKVQTPAWILEGYDSPAEYAKAIGKKSLQGAKTDTHQVGLKEGCTPMRGENLLKQAPKDFQRKSLQGAKTFKIRECPECGSDDVGLVLSNSDAEEGGGKEWECRKCKWKGTDIVKKELTEDELMKYLDEIAPKGVPSIEGDINIEGKEIA